MKHKLRYTACGVGILIVLLGAAAYVTHVQSKSPLAAYKAKLGADGEKLAIGDWIPTNVPADQNGAEFLRQAIQLSSMQSSFVTEHLPPAMRMVAPGKAMIGWQQPDIHDDQGTNSWETMDAALESRSDELELLHKIIDRPTVDFELDYRQGFRMLLPHLAKVKAATQLLMAAATCDLHRGDAASAVTNTRAILAIVRGEREERVVISQLVRIAMAAIAISPTWELLQTTNVTDAELSALQTDWEKLEFAHAAERSMEMERAMALQAMAEMRTAKDPSALYGYGGSSSSGGGSGDWLDFLKDTVTGAKRQTAIALWRSWGSYGDEMRLLQGEQVLIDSFRQLETNRNFRLARDEQERKLSALGLNKAVGIGWVIEQLDEGDLLHMASSSVLALQSYLKREMTIEAERQLAVTAIALKRYALRHGKFPDDLQALVPDILSAIPLDPVDATPLRYRRNNDGTFLLYSAGEDGIDDGGDATAAKPGSSYSWQRGRDLVWPQPANAKEVQTYLETNARGRR